MAPLPGWKKSADFVVAQASFDLAQLLRWRERLDYDGQVFAGVLVVASPRMARALAEATAQISVPAELLAELEHERDAGVRKAAELVAQLRATGSFDGVHLVPVGRYKSVAALLSRAV
ncbi:hypothetical protein KALB_1320 [Kutzneria albida DSM 43870]|uniref:Methylenetetrahydrofolate reductase n=1 Tax=Kutzneria albida DSM 43870 TaxID=1449976 RepID=W5W0K5_9PSEU|nr:hypothetical protein KALB_1320 [Kutzneria albida DSM 43870]